jgi:hypothetical protein
MSRKVKHLLYRFDNKKSFMEKLSLFLFVLITAFSAQSQDFVYEGPARSEVRSFWTNAMGIQRTGKIAEGIAIMEAKLNEVKQKDPAYKTDKMEAELARWKAKAGNTGGGQPQDDFSKLNPTQKAIKADQLLRKLFDEVRMQVDARDLPLMQIKFKEYTDMVQQYISLNTKPKEGDIKRTKAIIEKQVYATNMAMNTIEAAKTKVSNTQTAEANYYTAKYNQLYWEAAVKIFPEETSYADQYKVITEFVNKNGSLADNKANVDKNNAEKVKNTKLPVTAVKDSKLEKVLTDGFNLKYGDKATALKAVLVQDGWTTLRNNISGVVTGRERSAKLAYKGKDGKCYLLDYYIFIREEFISGAFTNTKAVFNGLFGSEMLCENIK